MATSTAHARLFLPGSPNVRTPRLSRLRCGGRDPTPEAELSSAFSQYVLENAALQPRPTGPSHLMSPTAVVECQMAALQRNDWPEVESGTQTAFAFAKPFDAASAASRQPERRRTWFAEERYLTREEFIRMLRQPPYRALLQFDDWKVLSPMVFPSRRKDVAVQAVAVTSSSNREQIFTFCLEKISTGPYKNCWLTVGVRMGDYASSP